MYTRSAGKSCDGGNKARFSCWKIPVQSNLPCPPFAVRWSLRAIEAKNIEWIELFSSKSCRAHQIVHVASSRSRRTSAQRLIARFHGSMDLTSIGVQSARTFAQFNRFMKRSIMRLVFKDLKWLNNVFLVQYQETPFPMCDSMILILSRLNRKDYGKCAIKFYEDKYFQFTCFSL